MDMIFLIVHSFKWIRFKGFYARIFVTSEESSLRKADYQFCFLPIALSRMTISLVFTVIQNRWVYTFAEPGSNLFI